MRGALRLCRTLDFAPPRRLPRCPLHLHGQIRKISDMVTGEYDVIQGVVEQLMAYNSKLMPRLRRIALRPQDRLLRLRALHKPCTQFIEASSPTHSSPVAPFSFVGPCASAPPRHLPRHPLHFHGQVLEVSGIVTGEYNCI